MDTSFISPRFILDKVIGKGNFGVIYKAIDKETRIEVAIKLIRQPSLNQELENEVKVLRKLQGGKGIPLLYWSCIGEKYYVMELLGQNLNEKFISQHKILSDSNFVIIAQQILERIEFIHSKSIIHRDIKPHQLLLDRNKGKLIYLTDFGLSKSFESSNGTHIPYGDGKSFAGTFNYASVNSHMGFQQSRRDDLESYCYVLSYFFQGDLPWKINNPRQNEIAIRKMKFSVRAQDLFGKELILGKIFTYVKSLKFEQKPDYAYILHLLYEYKKKIPSFENSLNWKKIKRNKSALKKKIKRPNLSY